MKKLIITTIVLAPILFMCHAAPARKDRPAKWAQPIALKGVPNLYKVSKTLYRSAQPSKAGMKNLKSIGIVTIVNLRSFHSDRDEIGSMGLGYEHIYIKAWHPEEEDVIKFLKFVANHKRTPILVHCQHGADRTGAMCAIYRVAVEEWTKEEAIREMKKGGYGFHGIWENLVLWINSLDIHNIRKKAGIKKPTEHRAQRNAEDRVR